MTTTQAPVTIRPYRDADWPAICAIHDAARPQEVVGVMLPGTSAPLERAAVDEDLFDSDLFVACEGDEDGPVLGFVAIDGAQLTWLYVDPAGQRRGVGQALMDHVLPLIGADGWLTVLGSNRDAIGFYEAMGFTAAAVFPGDCEGFVCDVVRMCLPTSRHRERPPQPEESALRLAGYSAESPGHAQRDANGVWWWVA
jgi:ribosomal protein S18 acetylase RimI-like enzyme